jgi:hypothetical protein
MGYLKGVWEQEYGDVLETGIADPKTGEPLFVAVHLEGRGADVLTQSQLPEVSDVGDYASYVGEVQGRIGPQLQEIGLEIMGYSMNFTTIESGQNPVTQLMNSGQIDIINPDISDIAHYESALKIIGGTALDQIPGIEDPEREVVFMDIAAEVHGSGLDIALIKEDPGFSVIHAVNKGMQEREIPQAEIQAAMTPQSVVNDQQLNQQFTPSVTP